MSRRQFLLSVCLPACLAAVTAGCGGGAAQGTSQGNPIDPKVAAQQREATEAGYKAMAKQKRGR